MMVEKVLTAAVPFFAALPRDPVEFKMLLPFVVYLPKRKQIA